MADRTTVTATVRGRRAAGLSVAVAVLALAIPAAASAHRPATVAQKTAMVYHAGSRYYGGGSVEEARSAPARCFIADIATVVTGSAWGAWTFSPYADEPAHAKQCATGNGVAIEHRIGSRWYVLWEGSDGYPPTRTERRGSLTLQAVPRSVAKDLIAGLE
jgi:hypothetical protein